MSFNQNGGMKRQARLRTGLDVRSSLPHKPRQADSLKHVGCFSKPFMEISHQLVSQIGLGPPCRSGSQADHTQSETRKRDPDGMMFFTCKEPKGGMGLCSMFAGMVALIHASPSLAFALGRMPDSCSRRCGRSCESSPAAWLPNRLQTEGFLFCFPNKGGPKGNGANGLVSLRCVVGFPNGCLAKGQIREAYTGLDSFGFGPICFCVVF